MNYIRINLAVFICIWLLTVVTTASGSELSTPNMESPTASSTASVAIVSTSNLGFLNVFTDLSDAEIFVDSTSIGKESIVKLPLEPGEHWVQVKLNGQVVYSQSQTISANRSSTVVSDHFVDFITNTPSRGAIDREARRLRESRGDLAIGVLWSTLPQPAASIKWWAHKNIGVQLLGLGDLPDTPYPGMFGVRVMVTPGDKVFDSDVMHSYFFAGTGTIMNRGSLSNSSFIDGGIGVELKLGSVANKLFEFKYLLNDLKKDKRKNDDDLFKDILVLGVLNLCYVSGEISMQSQNGGPIQSGLALGFHVYF